MHITPPIAFLLLATLGLNACVSSIKPETKQLDFYDFGLQSNEHRVSFDLPIEQLSATDAIQHSNIRYRLNDKNPAQVFGYTESRWSTLPVELVRQKIVNVPATHSACNVKLQIVAFDQVFDSVSSSYGIVQLQASLIDRRSRKQLDSTLVSGQSPAQSADARGGVAALNVASTQALQQAADWAKQTSQSSSACQTSALP